MAPLKENLQPMQAKARDRRSLDNFTKEKWANHSNLYPSLDSKAKSKLKSKSGSESEGESTDDDEEDEYYKIGKYAKMDPESLPASGSSSLDFQMDTFICKALMSPSDYWDRVKMLDELQKKLAFGIIRPFGSFLTGLGRADSDVDVYFEDHENLKPNNLFHKLKQVLYNSPGRGKNEWYIKQMMLFTPQMVRIPFIRFTPTSFDIECDLSFANIMSVQNSKLILFLFSLNPVARPLTILVKEWSRAYKINKVKAIKSYAIALLVIVLLVRKKSLPSIEFLLNLEQNKGSQSPVHLNPVAGHWNVNFCSDRDLVLEEMENHGIVPSTLEKPSDLLPYLIEFFDLLQNIKSDQVVSTVSGEFIPREHFRLENHHLLPSSQAPFVAMVRSKARWRFQEFPSSRPLVIQDPFDMGYNVSEFCSCIKEIKLAAQETMCRLQQPDFLQLNPFTKLFEPDKKKKGSKKNGKSGESGESENLQNYTKELESYSFTLTRKILLDLNDPNVNSNNNNTNNNNTSGTSSSTSMSISSWIQNILDFFKKDISASFKIVDHSRIKSGIIVNNTNTNITNNKSGSANVGDGDRSGPSKNDSNKEKDQGPVEKFMSFQFSIKPSSPVYQQIEAKKEQAYRNKMEYKGQGQEQEESKDAEVSFYRFSCLVQYQQQQQPIDKNKDSGQINEDSDSDEIVVKFSQMTLCDNLTSTKGDSTTTTTTTVPPGNIPTLNMNVVGPLMRKLLKKKLHRFLQRKLLPRHVKDFASKKQKQAQTQNKGQKQQAQQVQNQGPGPNQYRGRRQYRNQNRGQGQGQGHDNPASNNGENSGKPKSQRNKKRQLQRQKKFPGNPNPNPVQVAFPIVPMTTPATGGT